MTLATWFWIGHLPALAGWAALLFAGQRGVTAARWAAVLLAAGYTILFALFARAAGVLVQDYGLSGVAAFFDVPGLQLLGWVHYLAFDLFVGSWIAEEGSRLGMPRALVIPCLLLTFLIGPFGLLVFFLLRSPRRNSIAS
jgi:hypothetical protein